MPTKRRLGPTAWVLVLANLVPVYGVLALGWEVFPLVLLFWLENVVVGVLNVFRFVVAQPEQEGAAAGKAFLIPFFCVHYGMFTYVHGVFVFAFFSPGGLDAAGDAFLLPRSVPRAIEAWHLGLPLALLAASHIFSFVHGFVMSGAYRKTTLQAIMTRPYGRIVVLHIAILLGGFLAMSLGSPVWALLLLIALKIGFDLRGHLRAS